MGHTLIPEGLPFPDQVPLFPQARCEIMSRERMVDKNYGVPPESIDEIFVGTQTAREIGWISEL